MLTFANAAIFAGFAALAIPPLVHFFSRRRIEEQDWAAMQFLQVSQRTRRKVYFEQFLLMLLRMLILALLVLALAAPVVTSTLFNRLGLSSGERDVIILIDGSASMACKTNGVSSQEAAKEWAAKFIDTLRPGDRVAVYQARQSLLPLLSNLSSDREQAKNALELLPPPRGSVDWPGCVASAAKLLEGARPDRDIVIISDNQRVGWADEATLPRWELGGRAGPRPRVWVANVAAGRTGEPYNVTLEPIVAARGVAAADRDVRFRSALRTSGPIPAGSTPTVRLEVDGRRVGNVPLEGSATDAVRPIAFTQRFPVGSHVVSLICTGDDFAEDNRQDFALEVLPAIPVLVVDGSGTRRGEFLRDALAPSKDLTPAFLVKLIPLAEFKPASLTADVRGPGTLPRVLVLSNIASLTAPQNEAVEKFLAEGGSVLATLGDQTDAAAWNRISFRAGQGWLPARIVEPITGDSKPLAESFVHPAVEVFKEPLPGGLHTAVFPQHWKLDLAAGVNGTTGNAVIRLTNREAFLVERGVGRGRAMMCAVPLDNSWGANLVALPDFVRLAHEVMYYLAGAKAAERNLAPGQAIVFAPRPTEAPAGVRVEMPDGSTKTLPVKAWPLVFDGTRESGAYKLTTAGGQSFYYAVRGDTQESTLTPASAEDRKLVADLVPEMKYVGDPADIVATAGEGPQSRDMWWAVMGLVLLMLAGEALYTRQLSKHATT